MSQQKIDKFISNMNAINATNVQEVLKETYTEDIHFIDPVRSINGIENLTHYFSTLYNSVNKCHFTLNNSLSQDEQHSLQWVMKLQHQKIAKNQEIVIEGASFIKYDKDKIIYHQDYYDLGALIYEKLPVLGVVIKKVRNAI